MDISRIQTILREQSLDAWYLYDFRGSNQIAWQTLGLPPETHCSRRWAVIIPAEGEPIKIVNGIETHTLGVVQANELLYANRSQWEEATRKALAGKRRIALEYSPNNAIPVVSRVDGGTVEWLRSLGFELVSSADIVQLYSAVWTRKQMDDNKRTAKLLREAMADALAFTRARILAGEPVREYDVQARVGDFFTANGLTSYALPSVSVNANSANPHYQPTAEQSALIRLGDTLLIDMWAKQREADSTYSDITWMAYIGETAAERPASLFALIAEARDAAFDFVRERFEKKLTTRGCDVDDVCRNVIDKAGYGRYFIHRTGHNIGTETHGPGANIDNYETNDIRPLIPMTSFSIEPGVYIPGDIGLRTEIDVVIEENGEALITGGAPQKELLPLLAPELDIQRYMFG
jgi:Xaa-Pro aminopeptidase